MSRYKALIEFEFDYEVNPDDEEIGWGPTEEAETYLRNVNGPVWILSVDEVEA